MIATAATVLLLRREAVGFSVFLVQRHRRSAFMPRMWVFPGGRVEPGDALVSPRVRGGARAVARFGYPAEVGRAVLVGAVRETFEEAGLWLGEGEVPEAERGPLCRDELGMDGLLARYDVALDLDVLYPWARWVTPEGEPRRFDTAFLVAVVEGSGGRHDAQETVDSGWFRPREVLDAGLARMGLAPPTWWTLTELAAFDDLEQVLAASSHRDLTPVHPRLAPTEHGFSILLPGHPDHPEPPRPGLPARIGLGPEGGWVASP